MKTINRIFAFTVLLWVLLATVATAQTADKGVAGIAATLGTGTSLGAYYNNNVTGDEKPDYIVSVFHLQWGILKDGLLEPESGVFLSSPTSFAAAGTGAYSGNTLSFGKKSNAKASVQIFATNAGGRYRAGTTHVLIKDDLGIALWVDLTYNNVFCMIKPPIETPIP